MLKTRMFKSQVIYEASIDKNELQVYMEEYGASGIYIVSILNASSQVIETKKMILE